VTPLAQAVTRLLAPDTERRLAALAAAHDAGASQAAIVPQLFLVSFFSYDADAAYNSEALQLVQLGRLLRPAAVLPVTPAFGAQRLNVQETQLAVYVFDHPIDYDQPLTVRYGAQESDAWTRIMSRLERERVRLRLRSAAPLPDAAHFRGHSGISYSLILRYSVRSPMPSISAALRRLPPTCCSAAVMAARSMSARVIPGLYTTTLSSSSRSVPV
jgi:hypothetical protein